MVAGPHVKGAADLAKVVRANNAVVAHRAAAEHGKADGPEQTDTCEDDKQFNSRESCGQFLKIF
jgi:hypothetical protein